MICAAGAYYMASNAKDSDDSEPVIAAGGGTSAWEHGGSGQATFDEMVATHAPDEFQVLDPGKSVADDLSKVFDWTKSALETGWTFAAELVDKSLSGIRSYAQDYERRRSTSLWEDIGLNVFANGLSAALFALLAASFGACFGVLFGRRRKTSATAE